MFFDYTGPRLVLERFYDVGCASTVLLLCWAVGIVALRQVGFSDNSALDRSLFGTALGAGVISTSILALGSVSLLVPWALAGLFGLIVGIAAAFSQTLYGELRRARSALVKQVGQPALLLLLVVVAFLVLQSAMPAGDWDVLTYHLDVPAEYLARGEVFVPEDNHHAAFVGLQHMLYIPLLAAKAQSAPAVLSAGFAFLLALTMFAAGRRLFDRSTGRLSSALLWGSPVILLVAVTSRVDVTAAWLLLLVHYAIAVCVEHRELGGWFWIGAVAAGFAFGTKYSALAYLAALSPVIAWAVARATSSPREWSAKVAGFGGLFLIVAAPWLLKNIALFGAPLYPFFTDLQLESWLAAYVGSSTVPASVDPEVFQVAARTREPLSLTALFTDPGSMTPEREGAFYFANLALLLLPVSVLFLRRKVLLLLGPAVLYALLVIYPNGSVNLRYLIPALVVGTLVASWVLIRTGERLFPARASRRVFVVVVGVLCLLPAGAAAYFKISEMRPHELWLGARSEAEYLKWNENPDVYRHARVRGWANARLEDDDRVVMLFESRGYGFEPQVLQDNLNQTWPILASQAPWEDCLAPTGATHVLVNYAHLKSLIVRGLEPATVDWKEFGRFARSCLVREGAVSSVVLYRIVR